VSLEARFAEAAAQLNQENRRLKLSHPVVETQYAMSKTICLTRSPAIHVRLAKLKHFIITGRDCASFARRHKLARLHTERPGVSDRPRAFITPFGPVGVRAIFNDLQTVSRRQFGDRVHVSHVRQVNRDDRSRAK
jgi:hypothetical protein